MKKGESHQHKIRIIQKGSTVTYGVTIPHSLKHWFNSMVTITESGGCLILESGAIPTALNKKEIKCHSAIVERVKI